MKKLNLRDFKQYAQFQKLVSDAFEFKSGSIKFPSLPLSTKPLLLNVPTTSFWNFHLRNNNKKLYWTKSWWFLLYLSKSKFLNLEQGQHLVLVDTLTCRECSPIAERRTLPTFLFTLWGGQELRGCLLGLAPYGGELPPYLLIVRVHAEGAVDMMLTSQCCSEA